MGLFDKFRKTKEPRTEETIEIENLQDVQRQFNTKRAEYGANDDLNTIMNALLAQADTAKKEGGIEGIKALTKTIEEQSHQFGTIARGLEEDGDVAKEKIAAHIDAMTTDEKGTAFEQYTQRFSDPGRIHREGVDAAARDGSTDQSPVDPKGLKGLAKTEKPEQDPDLPDEKLGRS